VWEEGCAKEGGVSVGQGNLIGKEGILCASDKAMEEVHGGQVPSEELPEEDVRETIGCMKLGRGGHVEVGVEGDSLDVRVGKHSRSGGSELRRSRGGQYGGFMAKNHIKTETYVGRMCRGRAYRCGTGTGAFMGVMSLVTGACTSA
jgi:hypothetical protein